MFNRVNGSVTKEGKWTQSKSPLLGTNICSLSQQGWWSWVLARRKENKEIIQDSLLRSPDLPITNRQLKIQALNTHPWFLASSRKSLLECTKHRFAYYWTPPWSSASSVPATKSLPGYLSFCLQYHIRMWSLWYLIFLCHVNMKTVRAQVIAWHSGDGVFTVSTRAHVSQVVYL